LNRLISLLVCLFPGPGCQHRRFGMAIMITCGSLLAGTLFSCKLDHGLHPIPITGIQGTVSFLGTYPSNTEWVRILCFSEKPNPQNFLEILAFLKGISDPLPAGVRTHSYIMELQPGTYKWVAIAWKPEKAPMTSLSIIGEYRDPANPEQPGTVVVRSRQLTRGIDITADFRLLQSPSGSTPLRLTGTQWEMLIRQRETRP